MTADTPNRPLPTTSDATYPTTWEREITKRRKAMSDDTPIVAAAWRKLDKSGKPSTEPTTLWKQGDDQNDLNAFLRRRFDRGYGLTKGHPFVAWTQKCAYFAVGYDGGESVGAVPLALTTDYKPTHIGEHTIRRPISAGQERCPKPNPDKRGSLPCVGARG